MDYLYLLAGLAWLLLSAVVGWFLGEAIARRS